MTLFSNMKAEDNTHELDDVNHCGLFFFFLQQPTTAKKNRLHNNDVKH